MDEIDWLAARFEQDRAHLRAVAYRMLGSSSEADDAVQEAWLRQRIRCRPSLEALTTAGRDWPAPMSATSRTWRDG